MKTKPRASKIVRKPTKKAPAKKRPSRGPRAKAVGRGPSGAKMTKRAVPAKKAVARKAPAKKARRTSAIATKKPARVATRSRTAARAPRSNGRVPVVREFTKREAWALFDSEARKRTGMSGKEFIEWWHRGEFEKDPDDIPGVMGVAMLLPLVEAD